ncbi:MAG TPA: biotin/lipoyl-containing protein, partial [Myxococcota bacterium]|nr:biotin/lipoyl-containing protein [Myxococcota bacterium]
MEVRLPELGESIVEATLGKWLVKEGDRVEQDQPLVEVTTDKADAELPAPAAGVVEKILVAEGAVVRVGTVLARIAEAGARPAPEARAERARPAWWRRSSWPKEPWCAWGRCWRASPRRE